MPTVIIGVKGYRISFFSADLAEPPHVHVTKSEAECKVWIEGQRLAYAKGFREHELRTILVLIREHQEEIMRAWNESSRNRNR